MKQFNFSKAILKYAIFLAGSYTLNYAWIYIAQIHLHKTLVNSFLFEYSIYIPRIIRAIFNVIFSIMVYLDLKKNKMKSTLTVILTLFFGFIGIALFFIQYIYFEYVKSQTEA